MKAKNRFVIVGVVMVIMVSLLVATNCMSGSSNTINGAGGIDAGDITSGKLSNDRLSMGSGSGLDADMVDGLDAQELIQASEEPAQIIEYVHGSTQSADYETLVDVTGGGYLYTLASEHEYGGPLDRQWTSQPWPNVAITIDGYRIEFSMGDFTTGGYISDYPNTPSIYEYKFAQCNLGIRFDHSLTIQYRNPGDGGSYLRVVYSTDL